MTEAPSTLIRLLASRAYHCGNCALWRRSVSSTMPFTPATVNCGRTRFDDLCEQWYPAHLVARLARRWRMRGGQ